MGMPAFVPTPLDAGATTAMHARIVASGEGIAASMAPAADSVLPQQAEPAPRRHAPTVPHTVPALDPLRAFVPSRILDVPPLPRSAPDVSVLTGTTSSGLPLKLRLFVDQRGRVVDVRMLKVSTGDEEAAERLKRMFFETLFLPGKQRGSDVASYMDVELTISDAK